jgi:hypothetical protein
VSQYGAFSVFQRLTADSLNSLIPDTTVKQTVQTVTSSTTFVSDTELFTPNLAIGQWDVVFEMLWGGAVALKTQWLVTGTMAGPKRIAGPYSATTDSGDNVTTRFAASGYTTGIVYGPRAGNAAAWAQERSLVTVTAPGFITLQWAQNVSSATGTVMNVGSYVRVKQVG